jgi:hypothetical protein
MRKITDYKQTKAVNRRGVKQVALVGYSHGGGSVYNLSVRLQQDQQNGTLANTYSLVFTAYIDAVQNNSYFNSFAETRRPLGSLFHTNQYQRNNWMTLAGDSVAGAEDNLDRSALGVSHSLSLGNNPIDTNPVVRNFLTLRFKQKVVR